MKNRHYILPFVGIFFLNFIFFLSHASINMIPDYLNTIGASNSYIGLYMNINSLELLFFVMVLGTVASKLSRKPTLLIAHMSLFISMILSYLFADNLTIMMVLRFLSAVSYIFGYTINLNMIYDILPYEKRFRGVAFFGISGIISNPTGAFIGEWVVSFAGGKGLFLLSAIISAMTVLYVLLLKLPTDTNQDKIQTHFLHIISRKKLRFYIIVAVIFGGAYGVVSSFLPNYTQQMLGKATISGFFTPFAIVAIIYRVFFSWTMDVINKKVLMLISLFFILLSLVNLIFLKHQYQLAITGFLYGIGHSVLFPLLSGCFVNSGGEHEKVSINNAFVAINVAGTIIFAYLSGLVSDFLGLQATYFIYSLIIAITIISFILIKTMKQNCTQLPDQTISSHLQTKDQQL